MLSVILIYALIVVSLMYTNFNNGSSIEEKNNEIVILQTEISNLRVIRQPDPLAVDFNDFQSDINILKQYRRDWIQIYQQITHAMPENARLLSVEVNGAAELVMDFQFTSLQQIAEFTAIVGELKGIASASATNIELVELANITATEPPTNSGEAIDENEGPDDQVDQSTANMDVDEFIEYLENNIDPPKDESERILNELRWLMEQKSAEDQHGIIVPDVAMPDYPITEDWMNSGLFSLDEIEAAAKQLDSYKDQVKTPTDNTEDIKKIFVYQTKLSIKLLALDADKEVLP